MVDEVPFGDAVPFGDGDAPTRWSRIQDKDYEYLALRFWNPIFRFLKSRLTSAEEAQELAQEVFVRFMEKDLLVRASAERGSFRNFLFHVVRQMLVDHYRARSAAKRGTDKTVSIDQVGDQSTSSHLSPEESFDYAWYETLLDRAREVVKANYAGKGSSDAYRAFRLFYFGERGKPRLSHEEIARKLRLTMGQVRNHIHRAKHVFQQSVQDLVSEYATTDQDRQSELSDFRSFLDRHRIHGFGPGDLDASAEPPEDEKE